MPEVPDGERRRRPVLHALTIEAPAAPAAARAPAFASPLGLTPRHLAEKILTSRSALEGERKQFTETYHRQPTTQEKPAGKFSTHRRAKQHPEGLPLRRQAERDPETGLHRPGTSHGRIGGLARGSGDRSSPQGG